MNTANLQLEGLLIAVGSLLRTLRQKGLLGEEEVARMLGEAESRAREDPSRPEEVSPANVEAILFPIRFLQEDVRSGEAESYSALAARVGRGKRI